MKQKHRIHVSGIIFALVFVISAILGDGIIYGSQITQATTGQMVDMEESLVAEQPETAEVQPEEEDTQMVDVGAEIAVDTTSESISETDVEAETEVEVAETPEADGAEVGTLSVGEVEPEAEVESEPEPEPIRVDYVIANVDTSLNIRSEPSTAGSILGKLYRGAKGDIVERGEEWTHITSGTVEGYVSNEYLLFDEDAIKGAEEYGIKKATVTADALRIRKEPSTDATVLDLAEKDDELPVAELTAEEETQLAEAGWVAIDYSSTAVGYVSAEFVTVAMELEEALSIEEEKKLLEEQKRKEQEARMATAVVSARNTTIGVTNREPFVLSDEDAYLLASVVHMESGNQCHEGKLAVANVVLTRLRSGIWGNKLSGVVYAPRQFSGANTGLLQKYMDQGPNEDSILAAAEAIAGVNNIGDYMYFCANRIAEYDRYSKYTIIEGHTFYKK